MASSRVEQTRLLHQDLEANAHECAQDLLDAPTSARDAIARDLRVKNRCEIAVRTGKQLLAIYEDKDNSRKRELDAISENVFEVFYEQLDDLRTHHRLNPQIAEAQAAVSAAVGQEVKVEVEFSGEEHHGRFLDLGQFHARYLNMNIFRKTKERSERKIPYVEYLSVFDQFSSLNKSNKCTGLLGNQYKEYLGDLLAYLRGFFVRVEPLVEVEDIESMIVADFEERWAQKKVEGWFTIEAEGEDAEARKQKEDEKERELESNPLYCVACAKLFTKTSVYTAHLSGKKHKKNEKKAAGSAKEDKDKVPVGGKAVAVLEERIVQFAELLRSRVDDTLVYIQNKQTRTFEEIAADLEEEKQREAELKMLSSDSEEEAVISNPLNLPLGWDGKPIPFWLYKLHGLNIEFKCEICGNFTYRGPRAFRRHFREWRHAYGMRCLGIPNTDHYFNITTFKDAIALHKKLLAQLKGADFKAEDEEEFEDAEGHVFNKKTYDDLRRQGIL